MSNDQVDIVNKDTMRKSVSHYSKYSELTRSERAALDHLDGESIASILDIGIGGGRTVDALRQIGGEYIGIDYVQEMVDECKRKFPGVHFEQGDARRLNFPDNRFQLVFFSLHGICMVEHEGRMQILKEVFRVLAPGGYFLFSTFNEDFTEHKKFFRFDDFHFSKNPLRLGVRTLRYCYNSVLALLNRLRFRKYEIHTDEYAIVNDRCHNYATMLYYITDANQKKQLLSAGFDNDIVVFDALGKRLEGSTPLDSLFYIARKPLSKE